jgi:gluconate 5-dehydrogenase
VHVRDLFDLSGKVAVVTGGSRGLGLQLAEALGEAGCKVALTARKQEELDAAAARLRDRGFEVLTVACDLAKPERIPAVTEAVLERFGAIDVLVNNAGASWAAPAEEYPLEAWDKVMALNATAVFVLSQDVARRAMIPRRAGKIVNIASEAGLSGGPPAMKTVAYNASKAAAINLTRALASEWGRFNINVNAICPGFFPTRMSRGLLGQLGDAVLAHTPLGRLGGDDDLKGAVVFLASEASRHVTGQTLSVDGGSSIV